ncbi:MAG: M48 family metalloprotease [Planctomycetota bacterium]
MNTLFNNVKTAALLGTMFGLILVLGLLLGGRGGLIIAFGFAIVTNFVAFFFSDTLALKAMRGQEVSEQTPGAGELVEMVHRLADRAALPRPRVYICPQQAPNAFATGRSPKKAAVAVTQGALQLLTYDELEGVMAHELAHVKNRDTLTSTIAATIAGAISFIAWMSIWDREAHPLVRLGAFLLAPIAASVVQMAISRSREFVADADGAAMAGSPNGLISALQKLEGYSKRIPMQTQPSQNHMFIVQPFSGAGKSLANLFATHPPTQARIEKLRQAGV